MTITSLKELNKLMMLCKKQGIKSIKIDNIEFTIDDSHLEPVRGEYVQEPQIIPNHPSIVGPDTKIVTDSLTEEQLLFYSAEAGVNQ